MQKIYDTIYKIDIKGKVRVWYMEQDGSRYRTIAGIRNGKLVTSGWTQTEATNVGRSNERNPVAQATFEIEAEYKKNLTREYHHTIEGAGGGAHFFKPMLAEKYASKEFTPGYAQPKLDGIRCIAKKDGLWSRKGKPILGVPHILDGLKEFFVAYPNEVLDGELYNHDLKDDFNQITSIVRTSKLSQEDVELSRKFAQYHIYDLPMMDANFHERSMRLTSLLEALDSDIFKPVLTVRVQTTEDFDNLHIEWLSLGYEGSIWRDDTKYERKRTFALRKRKDFIDEEFPISKIIEGNGNWAGCAKAVEFIMPGDKRGEDGERPKAGIKGTQAFARALLLNKEKYTLTTIRYFLLTPAGVPRLGVATVFYEGDREL